ncbi:hypothetical protein [Paucilactobacillus nenjiangensis]|nr:hypothetical protein [Paucilactobacillus nenjiangensis]
MATNNAGSKNTNQVITSNFMTPQGVAVTPKYIITSSYDHEYRGASILSIIDRSTGKHLKNVILQGRPHVGGVAYEADKNLLWVCGSSGKEAALIAIKMDDIDSYDFAKSNNAINYTHVALLPGIAKASTVAYRDGQLWVGFFSVTGDSTVQRFDVDKVLSGRNSIKNVSGGSLLGNDVREQLSQQSIGKIQGFSFYKNLMYISQSYGSGDSEIYVYKIDSNKRRFTKNDAEAVIKIPSHLEQITIDGNRMYAIFESSARSYKTHEQTRIGRVVSFDVSKLPPLEK